MEQNWQTDLSHKLQTVLRGSQAQSGLRQPPLMFRRIDAFT